MHPMESSEAVQDGLDERITAMKWNWMVKLAIVGGLGSSLFGQNYPPPTRADQYGQYDDRPYSGDPAYGSEPYDPAYDTGVYAPPPPPVPAYAYYSRPPMPGPGYCWVDGYWNFYRGRYIWVAGYWMRPPYAGGYWVSPRYTGGRFFFGFWGGGRPYGGGYYRGGYVAPRPVYRAPAYGYGYRDHGSRHGHRR